MKISRDVDGDKYIYIGQFRQGTKDADGIGIQVWRDGTIYEGYVKNGKRNGTGRYIWPTGDYYIGEWKNGQREGHGDLHIYKGPSFSGFFVNNEMHGQGILKQSSRVFTKGEWRHSVYQKKNSHCTIF